MGRGALAAEGAGRAAEWCQSTGTVLFPAPKIRNRAIHNTWRRPLPRKGGGRSCAAVPAMVGRARARGCWRGTQHRGRERAATCAGDAATPVFLAGRAGGFGRCCCRNITTATGRAGPPAAPPGAPCDRAGAVNCDVLRRFYYSAPARPGACADPRLEERYPCLAVAALHRFFVVAISQVSRERAICVVTEGADDARCHCGARAAGRALQHCSSPTEGPWTGFSTGAGRPDDLFIMGPASVFCQEGVHLLPVRRSTAGSGRILPGIRPSQISRCRRATLGVNRYRASQRPRGDPVGRRIAVTFKRAHQASGSSCRAAASI